MESVTVAARRFGIDALKPEQEDMIKAFVGGKDVCMHAYRPWLHAFALLPYLYDHLRGLDTSQQSPFDHDLQIRQGCEVLIKLSSIHIHVE